MIEALYSGCKIYATCSLSESAVKNLTVCKSLQDYVEELLQTLGKREAAERVLFNTMDKNSKENHGNFIPKI